MSAQRVRGWYDSDDDGVIRHWDGSDWTDTQDSPDNWDDLPAPGWYADPDDESQERYWNGLQWLEKYRPVTYQDEADSDAIWQATSSQMTGIGGGSYELTERHLFFETGTLTTDSQQVPIAGVQDVDVKQSVSQKARDVADVIVHVQRSTGDEETVVLKNIEDYDDAQRLINETAHEARLRQQRRQKTVRHQTSGSDEQADPADRLERLDDLRERGVLTDEEFEEKKADVLAEL